MQDSSGYQIWVNNSWLDLTAYSQRSPCHVFTLLVEWLIQRRRNTLKIVTAKWQNTWYVIRWHQFWEWGVGLDAEHRQTGTKSGTQSMGLRGPYYGTVVWSYSNGAASFTQLATTWQFEVCLGMVPMCMLLFWACKCTSQNKREQPNTVVCWWSEVIPCQNNNSLCHCALFFNLCSEEHCANGIYRVYPVAVTAANA